MSKAKSNFRIIAVEIKDNLIAHVQRIADKDEIYVEVDKHDFDTFLIADNRLEIGKAYSNEVDAHIEMMPITLYDYYSHAIDVNDNLINIDMHDYLLNDEIRLQNIEMQFAADDVLAAVETAIKDASMNSEEVNKLNKENVSGRLHYALTVAMRNSFNNTLNLVMTA